MTKKYSQPRSTKKSTEAVAVVSSEESTSGARTRTPTRDESQWIEEQLRLGYLLSEKCELKKAREIFQNAREQAFEAKCFRLMMEAISALLRLAAEALDQGAIEALDFELNQLMAEHPKDVPSLVWYCKGQIARFQSQYFLAQRYFRRYLRAVRAETPFVPSSRGFGQEEAMVRAWVMLALIQGQRNHARRAKFLCEELLRRYEAKSFPWINGALYMQLGNLAEKKRDLETAMKWYQKAHAAYLAERNWLAHLAVLYGYARIARIRRNYSQAYWYLDLIDKASTGPELGVLRREIGLERQRLEQDAVDLLIDSRRCVVKTRDAEPIALGKQYVLLDILEALSDAHQRPGDDGERGLSKAEIIEKVWNERYRPEAHDNKLYYNINRLRKLIEPDMRSPKYLLNWKEGYRLAPGLKVHLVSSRLKESANLIRTTGEGKHK